MSLVTLLRILVAAVILLPILGSRPTRWLYTAVTVAAFLLAPFEPPWVGSSLASTLNDLATFCDGAVVALIWFSDLRLRFGSVSP